MSRTSKAEYPIELGENSWGKVFQWVRGKAIEAANFLRKEKGGYLKGVFFQDELGEIDLFWGDNKGGLAHIIDKHIVKHSDFSSIEDAINSIDKTITYGQLEKQKNGRLAFVKDGKRVVIEKTLEGNRVVTAFDETRKLKDKKRSEEDITRLHQDIFNEENGELVSPNSTSADKVTNNIPNAQEIGEENVKFRVVSEEHIKDKLGVDKLETEKVYRAMQMVDGKLYPPMAGKVNGEWQDEIKLGEWEEAIERPDMVDEKGNFKLDKGNKKSLKARYNPYFHTSRTPLNDQFAEAQSRPNLVTVEVEVPKAELTSGYKAEKAKDAVGLVEWKDN